MEPIGFGFILGDVIGMALEVLAEKCPTMMVHRDENVWCLHLSEDESHGIRHADIVGVLHAGIEEVERRAAQAQMN